LLRKPRSFAWRLPESGGELFPTIPLVVKNYSGADDIYVAEVLQGKKFTEVDFDEFFKVSPFLSTTLEAGAYYIASVAIYLLNLAVAEPSMIRSEWYLVIYTSVLDQKNYTRELCQCLARNDVGALLLLYEVQELFLRHSCYLEFSPKIVAEIRGVCDSFVRPLGCNS
jgi:hypothetical protein